MVLLAFYFLFLTFFSVIGGLIGYLVEAYYPGSGNMVMVTIFMIALWGAWVLSVRITDRFWPEQPTA